MKKNKFKKGDPIGSVALLAFLIKTGQWIYLRDKPKHPSFISSMMFRTVTGLIDSGCLRYAELNEKED